MSVERSDIIASQETVFSPSKTSACSCKKSMVTDETMEVSFFRSLGRKLFCSSETDSDKEAYIVGRKPSSFCSFGCIGWFCCTSRLSLVKAEHESFTAPEGEVTGPWCSPTDGTTSSCRPDVHASCSAPKHIHVDVCDTSVALSADAERVDHPVVVLRHSTRDTLARSKAATVRRVMLADAEYGHATALDDCIMSDSDAWSSTFTSSRPNSGGEAGPEIIVMTDNNDELSESLNETGDDDDMWHGILPLPVPPVYDQVKEPSPGWSLASELQRLVQYGWYWGPITRVEAEEKLAGQDDGTFLVRDSSDDHYLLSLSFRSYGRTLHTRIEHCQGAFSLYAQSGSDGYKSIVELIERSIDDSRTGVFCYSRARALGSPSFPVRLTRPISRFAQVRSLQYLCRFLIRQHTRVDHIQQLPLPLSIKGWLEERPY